MQMEEERGEGPKALPLDIENCHDLTFVNLYLYRVNSPGAFPYGVRIRESQNLEFRNVHCYGPGKLNHDSTIYDKTHDVAIRTREISWLSVSGAAPKVKPAAENPALEAGAKLRKMIGGFENIDNLTADADGNLYFIDTPLGRVWKWSPETNDLALITDAPIQPQALAIDTAGNLLVVARRPGRWARPAVRAAVRAADRLPRQRPRPPRPRLPRRPRPPVPRARLAGDTATAASPTGTASGAAGGRPAATGSAAPADMGFRMYGPPVPAVYVFAPGARDGNFTILKAVPAEPRPGMTAILPQTRWRDAHDFLSVCAAPAKTQFLAPDGKSFIPVTEDLLRAYALAPAPADKPFLVADEFGQRVVSFKVGPDGTLTEPKVICEEGEARRGRRRRRQRLRGRRPHLRLYARRQAGRRHPDARASRAARSSAARTARPSMSPPARRSTRFGRRPRASRVVGATAALRQWEVGGAVAF